MMTGFHQNYIGANQHREHDKQPLPHGIKPIPHLFQEAGYFTALMSWKTDCNFTPNSKGELFMGEDWSERDPGSPSSLGSLLEAPIGPGIAIRSGPSTRRTSSFRPTIRILRSAVATGPTGWSRCNWSTVKSASC